MHSKYNVILRLAVAAALALGFQSAYAFHSGGVAECSGCHSMHSPKAGGSFLLIGIDQSSTCLSCHGAGSTISGYHVATIPLPASGIPAQRTPGGDFSWLQKTWTYLGRGTPQPTLTEAGQTHGHNVIAGDYSFGVDTDFTTAPGGTFPSSQLGCQSCHDPHGKLRRLGGDTTYTWGTTGAPIVGSGSYATSAVPTATKAVGHYRLLRGNGDATQGVTFAGVVIASAPGSYNQDEYSTGNGVLSQVRVSYGSGGVNVNSIGQYCASCHPGMHSGINNNYVHPIDQGLGGTIAGNYNSYVTSGIMTGTAATSFSSLTPFAEATTNFAITKSHATNASTGYAAGPANNDQVTCVSCHRAHASGFPDALRWYIENEFITRADGAGNPVYPGNDVAPFNTASNSIYTAGRTQAEWQAGYYNRPASFFGAVGFQRQLCNKCHAKD